MKTALSQLYTDFGLAWSAWDAGLDLGIMKALTLNGLVEMKSGPQGISWKLTDAGYALLNRYGLVDESQPTIAGTQVQAGAGGR